MNNKKEYNLFRLSIISGGIIVLFIIFIFGYKHFQEENSNKSNITQQLPKKKISVLEKHTSEFIKICEDIKKSENLKGYISSKKEDLSFSDISKQTYTYVEDYISGSGTLSDFQNNILEQIGELDDETKIKERLYANYYVLALSNTETLQDFECTKHFKKYYK